MGTHDAFSDDKALSALLDHVGGLRGADGTFPVATAPYVVEAAWASDLDPSVWPPEHPVLPDVRVAEGATFLQSLRPLYALALADAPGADDRRDALLAGFDGTQFGDPRLLNDDIFALLALDADGEADGSDAVRAASGFLLANRNDGLWSYAVGGAGGIDTTGMAVTALAVSGRLTEIPAAEVVNAIATARDGAGYAESAGDDANCDSTVWAIRGLTALGTEAPREAWLYLRTLQQADGGIAYRAGEESNGLCSTEVATLWGLRATERL